MRQTANIKVRHVNKTGTSIIDRAINHDKEVKVREYHVKRKDGTLKGCNF